MRHVENRTKGVEDCKRLMPGPEKILVALFRNGKVGVQATSFLSLAIELSVSKTPRVASSLAHESAMLTVGESSSVPNVATAPMSDVVIVSRGCRRKLRPALFKCV